MIVVIYNWFLCRNIFILRVNVCFLYSYELQLESKVRRQGLGRFMMNTLEALSAQSAMKKVVLTVLKHNPDAKTFFQSLGYV